MTINDFLSGHNATAKPQPAPTGADAVISEIAEQAVRSADAEKLLRTVEFALRHGRSSVRIRLDEGATSPAVEAARRLQNIGVVTHVRVDQDKSALFALAARHRSKEVSDRVARLMQNGRWLELGAAQLIRTLAAAGGHEVEVASQLRVTLSDGRSREIDVLACIDGCVTLVECKSGPRGNDEVGRFADLAASLDVRADRALLLAPHIDDRAAVDLMAFYPVTVLRRDELVVRIGQVLDEMATERKAKPAVAPLRPVTPDAPLHVPDRRVTDPGEVEAALLAGVAATSSPIALNALVRVVRDGLGCARRPVDEAARRLLATGSFLGADGESVSDYRTPIAGTRAPVDELVQVEPAGGCVEQRSFGPAGRLSRILGRRYVRNPESAAVPNRSAPR